jgi:hypothetical protein
MTRTIVALAVLSLVIGFVMWQRRRRAPVKQPEVTIVPAPEPVVEPMDSETYELVDAGIPEELIDQYVASKERGLWDRGKYGVVALVGASGLAYWHRQNETQKRHLREAYGDLLMREQLTLQERALKNAHGDNYLKLA